MQNDPKKEALEKDEPEAEPSTRNSEVALSLMSEIIGKDEMNLVEHPFAVLQYGQSKTSVIEIEWEHLHPHSKKPLHGRWRVAGDEELGLPGPMEERLYLALMQLTKESGSQTVNFSRLNILSRMNLAPNNKGYAILRTAFMRLKAISITADHCFWDARSKTYFVTKGFSLIDDFAIADEPKGRKDAAHLPLSSFKWNDVIYQSLQAGHLRSLDLGFAFSLELPLSMRLYRYLDKHRKRGGYYQRTYEIALERLCRVRLGMTASKYQSKYKERLKGAHDELLKRGYLGKIEYSTMTRGGEAKLIYTYACRPIEEQAVAYRKSRCFAALSDEEKDQLRNVAREHTPFEMWDDLEDPASLLSDTLWQILGR